MTDVQVLGGLLTMSKDRDARLRTLRFVQGRDPSGVTHAQLARIFCEVELSLTTRKLASLKQRKAKTKHLEAARAVILEADGAIHAPHVLAALETALNPPPPEAPATVPGRTHLHIDEQDVVILQVEPRLAPSEYQDAVFIVLDALKAGFDRSRTWLVFMDTQRPHVTGLSEWIAFSHGVPTQVVSHVQSFMHDAGMRTELETGRARHLDLTPLARLSSDGLEILVPAPLAGDPTRKRTVDRAGLTLFARGYELAPRRPRLPW